MREIKERKEKVKRGRGAEETHEKEVITYTLRRYVTYERLERLRERGKKKRCVEKHTRERGNISRYNKRRGVRDYRDKRGMVREANTRRGGELCFYASTHPHQPSINFTRRAHRPAYLTIRLGIRSLDIDIHTTAGKVTTLCRFDSSNSLTNHLVRWGPNDPGGDIVRSS